MGNFEREYAFTLGLRSLDKLIKSDNLKEIEPHDTYLHLEEAIKKLCTPPYDTDCSIKDLKFEKFSLNTILYSVKCVLHYGHKNELKDLRDRLERLRNLSNEDIWDGKEILVKLIELNQFTSEFLKEIEIEHKEKASRYDRIIDLAKNNVLLSIAGIVSYIFLILVTVLRVYI